MINLDCIGTNYIGIRGDCDNTEPTSGLYINDLPGMSLKLASSLADEQQVTGVQMIRQFEQQALRMVWSDIRSKLSKTIIIQRVTDMFVTGYFDYDTPVYLAPVAAEVGLQLKKLDYDPYTNIRINYVEVRANTTASGLTLKITEGANVTPFTFDIQAGIPTRVYTNYAASGGEVRITVDATALELEDISIGGGNSTACVDSCRCRFGDCAEVWGWDGTQETSQGYGLVANISCECSQEQFLCAYSDMIAPAVQMKLAILIMLERIASNRINYIVQNGKESAEQMLLAWQGGINLHSGIETPSEYFRIVSQISDSIKNSLTHQNSACISCGKIRAIESLP
jgi:hypothetical protein